MTIFDTDVLVWALRGNDKALDAIDAEEERGVSAIAYMELLRGAKNARDFAATRRFISLGGFSVLPVTEPITARAIAIMEALALKSGIGPADAVIAATALDGGHILCSGNYKHFKDVEGLRLATFRP